VAVDLSGNVYVADFFNNKIRKISPSGNVTTYFTTSRQNYAVAVDFSGNVYAPSEGGILNRITPPAPAAGGFVVPSELISTNRGLGNYYISTSGLQSTLNSFGPGAASNLTSSIDGLLGGPQTYTSQSMLTTACDNLGQQYLSSLTLPLNVYQTPSNFLAALSNQNGQYSNMVANIAANYIANAAANSTPTVQYAGSGVEGYLDGPRMSAQFYNPRGLAVDSAGTIYVADRLNHRIRKISATGMVTTLAGSTSGFSNAQGTAAKFNRPNRVAVDSAGNVYVTETDDHRIRKIDINSNVTTLAGSGSLGFANGQGTAAQFYEPWGVAVDSAGIVYVTEQGNHLIRKIDRNSNVTTLAGSTAGFANGQGTAAQFRFPGGITVDSAGIIYLVEQGTNVIRKIDRSSNVTTVAGFVNLKSGSPAYPIPLSGNTVFSQLFDIAIDSEGVIYVTDGDRPGYIRIIDRNAGVMYTMQSFEVLFGGGIAIDSLGNIYISHSGGNTSSGTFVGPIILKFTGSRIELNNATTTAIASLPAYPPITSSNVTTNIQSNTVAIYSGGYISSSKYLAVNPTSLGFSNLYTFCNATANAFYASNADGTNGQFFADGTLLTSTSDRRLKRDIVRMSNAIEKIQALSGVYYTRNDDPSHQRRVGFIAQEVEGVFPDLVFTDSSQMNYKSIKYESIGVALLEAIKELDIQCDELLSTIV
jgi:sugar lactone lactonase YvrE